MGTGFGVDCDPETWNMRADQVEDRITPCTKAIMVVHIYGLPVDMDPILALAFDHGLKIIEDSAEMHGAAYRGKPCGSFGDISVFSFYPNKHITTGVNDRNRRRRAGGTVPPVTQFVLPAGQGFVHEELGWNLRMSNLQAALGVAQLERLIEFVARKREMGRLYRTFFRDVPGIQHQPYQTP